MPIAVSTTWYSKSTPLTSTHSKKMHVRPRPEIVSLSLTEDVDPLEVTGDYLSPAEFKEALLDEETVILDARNDYEFDLGHFRGAIRPDIQTFRELPEWVEENREQLDGKKNRYLLYRWYPLRKILWLAKNSWL